MSKQTDQAWENYIGARNDLGFDALLTNMDDPDHVDILTQRIAAARVLHNAWITLANKDQG